MLEKAIYLYFSSLRIPDKVTMYDHLLLSLTGVDCIGTFNWDPLLMQSYCRLSQIIGMKNLPNIYFLHGNVAVTYRKCDYKEFANPECKQVLSSNYANSQLLYPTSHKNYKKNPIIRDAWQKFESALSSSMYLLVVGYSAPKSDQAAINAIKNVWTKKDFNLKQIEIVDIKTSEELQRNWSSLIFTHHVSFRSNFYETMLSSFPRRCFAAFFDQFFNVKFLNYSHGIKQNMQINETINYLNPLIKEEEDSFHN